MGTVLDKICDDKREHVARCKAERPLAQVEAAAEAIDATWFPGSFYARMKPLAATV